jgi:signal-transduction protein with cAMP-binding, CBS, and nucleotidyltransferase domain
MYLVMSGVIEVFVKQGRENLALETLGIGSIIGQYSLIESEFMICGFRAVSSGGALLLSFDK